MSRDSRFNNCIKYQVTRADGTLITVYGRRLPLKTASNQATLVSPGSRVDLISFDNYGDAKYWWALHDVSATSPNPFDMLKQPGTTLIVPAGQEVKAYTVKK